ncbi:MAG: T9SS type A sorting domain-containing protein [Bacteroidales bacterium]
MKTSFLTLLLFLSTKIISQTYSLGWTGNEVIDKNFFSDQSRWNTTASNGESCSVTTDNDNVYLHWKFGAGNHAKWAICFQSISPAISISDNEIIGIDVKGSLCKDTRNVRIKFEDGVNQAGFTWHGLASLNRWCESLGVLKNQFTGNVDWNNIKVITFEVSSDASSGDTQSDSGTVAFRKFKKEDAANWTRSNEFEYLAENSLLDTVKNKAIGGILTRQSPTGLFYTWREDKSSWLYGHGILLKVLTIEGKWENSTPANDCANAAEKLAQFFVNHQDQKGFWPRAWNTDDASIKVYVEGDGTIWMGDFPWVITGLCTYYNKTHDESVLPAITKAKSFLYNLINSDGKLYTIDINSNIKYEVTSTEAYCAAIQCIYEIGDTIKALKMLNYISEHTWAVDLKYWKEAINYVRPVLFANTWMSQLIFHNQDFQKALQALSFAGKALYTKGPGTLPGFDGIGPVATWYEGTLSYICANGPYSQLLFDSIVNKRLSDGTVPAYNDNFGSKVDVWAVDWSSLDATLWLYFASAKGSPFKIYYKSDHILGSNQLTVNEPVMIFPNPSTGIISITFGNIFPKLDKIEIYNISGIKVLDIEQGKLKNPLILDLGQFKEGHYLLRIYSGNQIIIKKVERIR